MKNENVSGRAKVYKSHQLTISDLQGNMLVLGNEHRFVEERLLRRNGSSRSFVVIDPGAYIYESCVEGMKERGYRVNVINLFDRGDSWQYNPFYHIHAPEHIRQMVLILLNTTDRDSDEYLLLYSILLNFYEDEELKDMTMSRLHDLIKGAVDGPGVVRIHEKLLKKDSDYYSNSRYQYNEFLFDYVKGSNDEFDTMHEVYKKIWQKLRIFGEDGIKRITDGNEICFENLYDQKSVLFITFPKEEKRFDVLGKIIMDQMFHELQKYADPKPKMALNTVEIYDKKMLLTGLYHHAKRFDDEAPIDYYQENNLFYILLLENSKALEEGMKDEKIASGTPLDALDTLLLKDADEDTAIWYTKQICKRNDFPYSDELMEEVKERATGYTYVVSKDYMLDYWLSNEDKDNWLLYYNYGHVIYLPSAADDFLNAFPLRCALTEWPTFSLPEGGMSDA